MKFTTFRAGLIIKWQYDNIDHNEMLLDDPILDGERFLLHLMDDHKRVFIYKFDYDYSLRFLKIMMEKLIHDNILDLGILVKSKYEWRDSDILINTKYNFFKFKEEIILKNEEE